MLESVVKNENGDERSSDLPDFAKMIFKNDLAAYNAHKLAGQAADIKGDAHGSCVHAYAALMVSPVESRTEDLEIVQVKMRELAQSIADHAKTVGGSIDFQRHAELASSVLNHERMVSLKFFADPAVRTEFDFSALAALALQPLAPKVRPKQHSSRARGLLRLGMQYVGLREISKLLDHRAHAQSAASIICRVLLQSPDGPAKSDLVDELAERHPQIASLAALQGGVVSHETEAALNGDPCLPALRAYSLYREALRLKDASQPEREAAAHVSAVDELVRAYQLGDGAPCFLQAIADRLHELGADEAAERALLLLLLFDGDEARLGAIERLAALGSRRIRGTRPIQVNRSPLLLISQIQRSGGSLISQLLDGHPEVLAMPHELRINDPKWEWPDFVGRDEPIRLFNKIFNNRYPYFILKGYSKPDGNPAAEKEVHKFNLDYAKFVEYFKIYSSEGLLSRRMLLDAFFSSFAQGWSGANAGGHRFVSAFSPRLNMSARTMDLFFHDYPDGQFLTMIREPRAWYSSARRHGHEYISMKEAIELWKTSALSSLRLAWDEPRRVSVVLYEDLVTNTPGVMKGLCERIGMNFVESLLVPTFEGKPLLANSSFEVGGYGIQDKSIDRWKEVLSSDEEAFIRSEALPIYESAKRRFALA